MLNQPEMNECRYIKWAIVLTLLIFRTVSAVSQDTEPPVITSPARDTTFECGFTNNLPQKISEWYNNNAGAQATDNSGPISFIRDPATVEQAIAIFNNSTGTGSNCGGTQSVSVTFIAVDEAGNKSSSTTATFKTKDTTIPSLNTVSAVSYPCTIGIRDTLIQWIQQKAGYIATDVCSPPVIWEKFIYNLVFDGDTIAGDGNIFNGPYPVIPDGICQWSINTTFQGKDGCDTIFFTPAAILTVTDNQPPVFNIVPPDITVECDNIPSPPVLSATDGCTRNIITQFSQSTTQDTDKSKCGHYNYTITRTWSAADACGNTTSHTQLVTVRDVVRPSVLNPAQSLVVTISCETYEKHKDSIYLSVRDNCSTVGVTFRDSLLSAGCSSRYNRLYTLSDACNNTASFSQELIVLQNTIPEITRQANNLTFDCIGDDAIYTALDTWLANRGGSIASSLCSNLTSFAAVKGSYRIDDPTTFPGTFPTSLPVTSCPSAREGLIRYLEVDFVYYDACGNAKATPAVFGIRDTIAPSFEKCPDMVSVVAASEDCMADITLSVPAANDNCSEKSSPVVRSSRVAVTSIDPPGPDAIADTVRISLGPISPFISEPISDGKLIFRLNELDIDLNTEYFTIFNEDNISIGNTPTGAGECESDTLMLNIPIQDLSRWIADGFIRFTLIPNIVTGIPKASVNNICAGSYVEASLSYDIDTSRTLNIFYKINDGEFSSIDTLSSVKTNLGKGLHSVTFRATDCAGNSKDCEVNVEVLDETPPRIICPGDTSFVIRQSVCMDTFWLSTDIRVLESCEGNQNTILQAPATKEASYLSFIFNETDNKWMARNKELFFAGVPKIKHLDLPVLLTVSFFGDNNQQGKQFDILGPGGILLGKTRISSQTGCGLSTTNFEIPATTFNQWIDNETLTLFAIPVNQPGEIQPCTGIVEGLARDSVSYLEATIQISDAKILISGSGSTIFSNVLLESDLAAQPIVLNAGLNTLTLTSEDASGNGSTCTFTVDAQDNEAPQASCKNAVITIDPSGIVATDILPESIDNGSADNCGIVFRTVVPERVDCSVADQDVDATLYVTDASGNTDSCTALIRVKSFDLKPTFSAGLCATDTLKLFANIPQATVTGTYSFHWDGPGNIEFFTENPMIPNADISYNGVYVLTVKGFNDCVSVGSLVVNINPLLNPKLEANEPEICENTDLVLTTTSYTGDITYKWYQGIFPTGVLIATTTGPQYILKPTVTGPLFYYVIASGPDCSSNASPLLKVTVLEKPTAIVNDVFITPCEGEQISLGSPVVNANYQYIWSGPAGYSETGRNPRIINDVNATNEGDYFLVIANKNCLSDTAVTRVEIFERPSRPVISAADIICEGSIFSAVATGSPNAERFQWFRDGVLITTTQQNNLIFTNANAALQGLWTVASYKGNCQSVVSPGKFIAIDVSLEIGITTNGPVCTGDSLKLQATFVPNATYSWAGPVNGIPSVANPVVPGTPGDYSVTITTPTGCENNASTVVETIEPPVITALSNDSKSCMSKQDIIRFFPTIFPQNQNFSYTWIMPDGGISSASDFSVTGLDLSKQGLYKLILKNRGCPSDTAVTNVSFTLIPEKPAITALPYYCEGDTIQLSLTPEEANVTYTWNTPLGQINSNQPKLIIPSGSGIYSGLYTATASRNGCASPASLSVNVDVRKRPENPKITGSTTVCFGAPLMLSGQSIPGIMYQWRLPDQSIVDNKDIIVEKSGIKQEGMYILSATLNGCEAFRKDSIVVDVLDEIKTPEFVLTSLALCTTQEGGAEICIKPESQHPGARYEFINQVSGQILGESSGNCVTVSQKDAFIAGSNFLIVRSRVGNCYSELSGPMVITLNTPPDIKAEAIEDDIIVCEGEVARLTSRFGPPLVNVQWKTLLPSNILSDATAITTLISGLQPGRNTVVLEYSIAGCPSFSQKVINLYADFTPFAENDTFLIEFPQSSWLDVLVNDSIPERAKITIVKQPLQGNATVTDGGIRFTPDPRFPEEQQIRYRVCADFCDELCKEAVVFVRYQDDIECRPPTIITPNQDGMNDFFVVPCLGTGKYPDNSLVVFNEWGQEVYYAKPYLNDWGGTFGNNPLPVGTYFYVFQTDGEARPINGFLIIQR